MATFGEKSIVVWGDTSWALPLLCKLAAKEGASLGPLALYFLDPRGEIQELPLDLRHCKAMWIVVRPKVEELLTLHSWWRRLPFSGRSVEVIVAECGWSDVLRVEELIRQLPRWPRIWLPPLRDESPASSGLSLHCEGRGAAGAPHALLPPRPADRFEPPATPLRRRAQSFRP